MQDYNDTGLSEVMQNATEQRIEGAPALELDVADYAVDLEGFEITEEQKNELLSILWSIMSGMVELGFTHDLCGQIFEGFENVPTLAPSEVELRSLEER